MKSKAIFNWSGGKDSAICLHKILQSQQYDVIGLLTSINKQYQRISMHGVRVDLLQKQSESIGLPLIKIQLPEVATMELYDEIMRKTLTELKSQGVSVSVFGDIFLEDLRKYREDKLSELNLKAVFPLWKIPTTELIHEFIDLGFKAIITCVNDKYLDQSFAGRLIDTELLKDLPNNVDPCGENGEFHSFVYDGPIFKNQIPFIKGEIIYKKYDSAKQDNDKSDDPFKNGFWYCDLV
jgi:uncharacterized protein (TIGR00290 family)